MSALILTTFIINNYCKAGEIPYGVTIKALNDVGQEGQSNTTVIFTREGSKYDSFPHFHY